MITVHRADIQTAVAAAAAHYNQTNSRFSTTRDIQSFIQWLYTEYSLSSNDYNYTFTDDTLYTLFILKWK